MFRPPCFAFSKVPSYGKPGDPRPTFCTQHKPEGAVNLLTPRCAIPGCAKGPVGDFRFMDPMYWLCRAHGGGRVAGHFRGMQTSL